MVLFIQLVVLAFDYVMKSYCVTIQMKPLRKKFHWYYLSSLKLLLLILYMNSYCVTIQMNLFSSTFTWYHI